MKYQLPTKPINFALYTTLIRNTQSRLYKMSVYFEYYFEDDVDLNGPVRLPKPPQAPRKPIKKNIINFIDVPIIYLFPEMPTD